MRDRMDEVKKFSSSALNLYESGLCTYSPMTYGIFCLVLQIILVTTVDSREALSFGRKKMRIRSKIIQYPVEARLDFMNNFVCSVVNL